MFWLFLIRETDGKVSSFTYSSWRMPIASFSRKEATIPICLARNDGEGMWVYRAGPETASLERKDLIQFRGDTLTTVEGLERLSSSVVIKSC